MSESTKTNQKYRWFGFSSKGYGRIGGYLTAVDLDEVKSKLSFDVNFFPHEEYIIYKDNPSLDNEDSYEKEPIVFRLKKVNQVQNLGA